MKLLLLCLALVVTFSWAQDTYHCPDGWVLQQDDRACRCFLFSGYERVTRSDADVLCSFHDAAWVAEIDYPGLNYWLKARLLEVTDVGEYASFWLGATTNGRHDAHNPGTWFWPHMNTTAEWSDWADGQPDNFGHEDCLAMKEYHPFAFPWARDYFWNDENCEGTHHYVCQNTCLQ